jgi:hypothetical protein
MTNKSSPHGGFISEGTVSHGTLRTQDLLRSFADEYQRVLPFNGFSLAYDAREMADKLDASGQPATDDALQTAEGILEVLFEELDAIATRQGFYFGAHPGDGSDFGYWAIEDDND